MAGFRNSGAIDIMFSDNVDFSGAAIPSPTVIADGQLLIGATATPNIRVNTLTQGAGITITNGAGTITIAAGGSVATTYTADSGTATPSANNINLLGQNLAGSGIQTTATGSTVTHRMLSPYNLGDFTFGNSSAATARMVTINNTDNTSGLSNASFQMSVGGTSGGDPFIAYIIPSGSSYSMGSDNSDSDNFKITNSNSGVSSGTTLFNLTSGGVPSFPSAGWTTDGVLYSGASGVISSTSAGTSGQVLTSNGPGVAPTYQSVSAAGAITTITGNSGGAESPSAGNFNIVGTGSITVAGSANTETVQLTGLTNHSLLVGAGTATITNLGVATNGQLPIGSTGADPVLAAITAGTNISVTNGAGSITIAGTGAASFTWSVITANQTAAVNNGYICNKGGTLALALPASSAVGDIIEVTGINTALGWQITQASGQQIFFGTSSTTSGATGTLTSSATRDSIRMVCVVANTIWNVISSIGNPTVV